MTRRFFVGAAALLTLLVVTFQLVWALSMPGFRGPDEPHHTNSILRLASGGGWPEPGNARVDASIIAAGKESGTLVSKAENFVGLARTKLINDPTVVADQPPYPSFFRNMTVVPHEERSAIGPVLRLDLHSQEIDQMSQHPPLYYAGGALVTTLFDLDEQPWDRMLIGLRIYGILLTVPLVPSLIYTARKLGARRTWALAAGFVPFGIPQYFAITGAVTNDTLAIGLGSLVVAALAKAGTEKITWRTVVLVGGSLGLALWSKGLLLAFGLALILVFLFKKDETWKARLTAALVSGVMALTIGWWWIHNIIRYGVIQPSGFPRSVPDGWDPASADFGHFFTLAYRSISTSFFSAFGWLEADFQPPLTIVLTVLVVVALTWGVIAAGRHRRTAVALLTPVGGTVLLLFAESWSTYVSYGTVAGVQGRYLYPFLAAFAVIVLGLRTFRGKALVLFTTAMVGIGAYGLIYFLRSMYPGYPWIDFTRYAHVTGIDTVSLTLLMEGTVVVLLGAFILATVIGLKESALTTIDRDETPLLGAPTLARLRASRMKGRHQDVNRDRGEQVS